MRKWGKNIEIDGSFYTRAGNLLPNATEMAALKASGSWFQKEGDPALYEETMENMLKEIAANQVGAILLDAIDRSHKGVRIIPLTSKEYGVKAYTPPGMKQQYRQLQAGMVGDPSASGNDSVIWFEPWSTMQSLFTGIGTSPYQILVHELQHSLRQVRGKFKNVGAAVGAFPDPEELYSVLIENMYLSAAGQPDRMRINYFVQIPFDNRSDKSFYKFYMDPIETWCKQLVDMTVQLERIYGIWNPIRIRRMVLDSLITL